MNGTLSELAVTSGLCISGKDSFSKVSCKLAGLFANFCVGGLRLELHARLMRASPKVTSPTLTM